jgi:hypothetical protein
LAPWVEVGAVDSTDVAKVKWLCEDQGCGFLKYITSKAAKTGSVEMLRWLRQKRCAVDKFTTLFAARRANNLPVLQYLIDEGCQLCERIGYDVVRCKDLKQLQWLHARGIAVDWQTAHVAVAAGAVDILAWLQQQGIEPRR